MTFTLTGSNPGTLTFNYGFAKYEDFGNKNFIVTDFEAIGLCNATDNNFNIRLLKHEANNWTYDSSSFEPGASVLEGMNDTHGTEKNIVAGDPFAFKVADLSYAVDGGNGEGIIIEITTTTNNSVAYMSNHIGVFIK